MAQEAITQHAILDYLLATGVYAWRNNSGAWKVQDRFVRFGKKGSSDILGILPGGRFLAIEVKGPHGKPTPAQVEFIDAVNHAGGLAFVAYSIDDAIATLKAAGY